MRNFAVLTVLGFVLSTAPCWAETMDAMFGNTVTVTHPDGAVDRYYFEPDGSFVERAANGESVSGRWTRRAGEVCLSVAEREDCAALPDDKAAGDAWVMETGGGSLAIAIVPGRG
ncbi:MAG TPA: hypothetical protein VG841_15925 [Caulobacterales bacterium]|nr:hypothetical protein [Caulobacterales bacterium]